MRARSLIDLLLNNVMLYSVDMSRFITTLTAPPTLARPDPLPPAMYPLPARRPGDPQYGAADVRHQQPGRVSSAVAGDVQGRQGDLQGEPRGGIHQGDRRLRVRFSQPAHAGRRPDRLSASDCTPSTPSPTSPTTARRAASTQFAWRSRGIPRWIRSSRARVTIWPPSRRREQRWDRRSLFVVCRPVMI